MKRQVLENFITKYNLGGACDKVTYDCSGKEILVRAISEDKNVLSEVLLNSSFLPEGKYSVYDTSRLKAMIGVLDDDVNVTPLVHSDTPYAIKFTDTKNTVVTYVLSDQDIIPSVPDLKTLPEFELQIKLTEDFVNTFIKAKGALMDSDTFTVSSENGTTEIVLGFANMNTNRIRLQVSSNDVGVFDAISFPAEYLKTILSVNKDVVGGTMEISSKGLSRLKFESDDLSATYYLVQIVTE